MANRWYNIKKWKPLSRTPTGEEMAERFQNFMNDIGPSSPKAAYAMFNVYNILTGGQMVWENGAISNKMVSNAAGYTKDMFNLHGKERYEFNESVNYLISRQSNMYKRMKNEGLSSAWMGRLESYMKNIKINDLRSKKLKKPMLTNDGIRNIDIYDRDIISATDAEKLVYDILKLNLYKYQGITGLRQYVKEFQNKHEVKGLFEGLTEKDMSSYWKIYNRIKQAHPAWDSEQIRSAVKMVMNGTIDMTTKGERIEGIQEKAYTAGSYQEFLDFVSDVLDYDDIGNEW